MPWGRRRKKKATPTTVWEVSDGGAREGRGNDAGEAASAVASSTAAAAFHRDFVGLERQGMMPAAESLDSDSSESEDGGGGKNKKKKGRNKNKKKRKKGKRDRRKTKRKDGKKAGKASSTDAPQFSVVATSLSNNPAFQTESKKRRSTTASVVPHLSDDPRDFQFQVGVNAKWRASELADLGQWQDARDMYLVAVERFSSWLQLHGGGRDSKHRRMAHQYKDECDNLADELTRAYGLPSSSVVRGAAQFFVKYYGVVEGLREWTCFASRSEVLDVIDAAKYEDMLPWRLPDSSDISILTVSVYGLKVTDQMMSEPPLMREPLYAVASYNCVQEAEGHYVIMIKTGDSETGEFFAHVLEVADERRATEICSLIERTIAEAFKQAHPFEEAHPVEELPPAPPLPPRVYNQDDLTSSQSDAGDFIVSTANTRGTNASRRKRMLQRGSKREKSKAALLEETAAFKPVQASQGAVGDMGTVMQFMQMLQSELEDEELSVFAQLMRDYRAPQGGIGIMPFCTKFYRLCGQQRHELFKGIRPFINNDHLPKFDEFARNQEALFREHETPEPETPAPASRASAASAVGTASAHAAALGGSGGARWEEQDTEEESEEEEEEEGGMASLLSHGAQNDVIAKRASQIVSDLDPEGDSEKEEEEQEEMKETEEEAPKGQAEAAATGLAPPPPPLPPSLLGSGSGAAAATTASEGATEAEAQEEVTTRGEEEAQEKEEDMAEDNKEERKGETGEGDGEGQASSSQSAGAAAASQQSSASEHQQHQHRRSELDDAQDDLEDDDVDMDPTLKAWFRRKKKLDAVSTPAGANQDGADSDNDKPELPPWAADMRRPLANVAKGKITGTTVLPPDFVPVPELRPAAAAAGGGGGGGTGTAATSTAAATTTAASATGQGSARTQWEARHSAVQRMRQQEEEQQRLEYERQYQQYQQQQQQQLELSYKQQQLEGIFHQRTQGMPPPAQQPPPPQQSAWQSQAAYQQQPQQQQQQPAWRSNLLQQQPQAPAASSYGFAQPQAQAQLPTQPQPQPTFSHAPTSYQQQQQQQQQQQYTAAEENTRPPWMREVAASRAKRTGLGASAMSSSLTPEATPAPSTTIAAAATVNPAATPTPPTPPAPPPAPAAPAMASTPTTTAAPAAGTSPWAMQRMRQTAAPLSQQQQRQQPQRQQQPPPAQQPQPVSSYKPPSRPQDVAEPQPQWKQLAKERQQQRLSEPERQRQIEQQVEEQRWRDVPTWKRKVLQRKQAEAMLPALKQQAIDNYWRQRAQELSHLPNFKREVMIKKEKEEVRQGIRRLPPEIFKDIHVPGKSGPPARQQPAVAPVAPQPHLPQQQQQQQQQAKQQSSGVFLPPPPPPV